jgi:hypothetical protein
MEILSGGIMGRLKSFTGSRSPGFMNPAARAGGCADLCMFGRRERRAPARLSWLQLHAYAAAGSGWMCPSWVKRVYWS